MAACEEAFVSLKVKNSGAPAVSREDTPLKPRMQPVNVKLSLVNVNKPATVSAFVISTFEIAVIGLSTTIRPSPISLTLVLGITTISSTFPKEDWSTTDDKVTISLILILVVFRYQLWFVSYFSI